MTDNTTARNSGESWREVAADALEVEIHWREAHHHLGDTAADSCEAGRLRAEMQALQEEYVRLIEEARRHGRGAALTLLSPMPGDAASPGSRVSIGEPEPHSDPTS